MYGGLGHSQTYWNADRTDNIGGMKNGNSVDSMRCGIKWEKKYIKPKDLEQRPLLCFFMFCFDTIKLPGNEKMEIIVIVLAFDGLISVYNMFSATYLSMLT